jgi:hypothetical protein
MDIAGLNSFCPAMVGFYATVQEAMADLNMANTLFALVSNS